MNESFQSFFQACEVLTNGTEICHYITGESIIVDQMGFDIVSTIIYKS